MGHPIIATLSVSLERINVIISYIEHDFVSLWNEAKSELEKNTDGEINA